MKITLQCTDVNPSNLLNVIKAIRALSGLGLVEAKHVADMLFLKDVDLDVDLDVSASQHHIDVLRSAGIVVNCGVQKDKATIVYDLKNKVVELVIASLPNIAAENPDEAEHIFLQLDEIHTAIRQLRAAIEKL